MNRGAAYSSRRGDVRAGWGAAESVSHVSATRAAWNRSQEFKSRKGSILESPPACIARIERDTHNVTMDMRCAHTPTLARAMDGCSTRHCVPAHAAALLLSLSLSLSLSYLLPHSLLSWTHHPPLPQPRVASLEDGETIHRTHARTHELIRILFATCTTGAGA